MTAAWPLRDFVRSGIQCFWVLVVGFGMVPAPAAALCMYVQIVMLGTGAADYEDRVRAVTHDYGWFCRGHVGFSVPLSHRIIAGCDILLMPSRYDRQYGSQNTRQSRQA